MAHIHKLTDRQIRAAKKPLGDGGGLWVYPRGSARTWIFRYSRAGKQVEMGLGGYPDVALAEARERAAEARKLRKDGIDPLEHRRQQEAAAEAKAQTEASKPTFTQAAARYIRSKRHEWSNAKHARQWVATLKTYARPVVGSKPVDQISTEDVLTILKPVWTSKTETAKRVQGRVENVLDFAAAMKWRDASNPCRWRGHLDKLLPAPTKVKKARNGGTTRHQPAMDYNDMPTFMVELRELTSISANALEFSILTACRTSEVLGAQWSEIDAEAAVWTIPASRMKARREHRVPLSDVAMAVLERLPRVEGNPHCFPGARHGKPLSNMALLQVMRGMGYGVGGDRGAAVVHGFRSSFRDWAGEVATFPPNVAEAALAHVIGDKTEAAYARGDLFQKRRKLMQEWADWCGLGAVQNVVELHPEQAVG